MRQPDHYCLDGRTVKDLGLLGSETEPCRKYLISDRGRMVYERWLISPLTDTPAIRDRQEMINALRQNPEWLSQRYR